MLNDLSPHRLTWSDVDPARHAFDPCEIDGAALAQSIMPLPDRHDWEREQTWLHQITTVLVQGAGPWAVGWNWARGEGDWDGGPVRSWCCVAHSVSTPEETVELIKRSLLEWRRWLEQLADSFARLTPAGDSGLRPDDWERAVARLVTLVAEQTEAGSAWYRHCLQVLGWFLESQGIDHETRWRLIYSATSGRFRSWSEPPQAVVQDIARAVADGLARR